MQAAAINAARGVPSPPPAPTQALTPTPAPQRAVPAVIKPSAPNAVFDPDAFAHLQRVAKLMAMSSLVPSGLCMEKDGNGSLVRLDDHIVLANCFLVAEQAQRWGMSPFAVAQCVGVVHGKLVYEGKLVHAVLEANLGVRLNYTFDNGVGDQLGVTVSGTLPGEATARTIFGRVCQWHKGPKSPWVNPADWPRQLRYMGAREWARAHAPGSMLGVVSIDEMIEPEEREYRALAQRAMAAKTISPPKAPPAPPAPAPEQAKPVIEAVAEADDPFSADQAHEWLASFEEECMAAPDMATLDEVLDANQATIDARLSPSDRVAAGDCYQNAARRFQ